MGQEFWVNSVTGDDANDGLARTQVSAGVGPILTLANLSFIGGGSGAGTADDDIINLTGTFREPLKIGASAPPGQRLIIRRDSAASANPIVRGDTIMNKAAMTKPAATTNVFRLALAAGTAHSVSNCTLNEGIATVVKNWDASIDALGRHYGHLTRAQSQAHCHATANTWWFEPTGTRGTNQDGAGNLDINDAGYGDSLATFQASADIFAYVIGNVNGVEIGTQRYNNNNYDQGAPTTHNPNGTRSLTIDGIDVYLFADSGWRSQYNLGGSGIDVHATNFFYNTNSIGYGIRPSDCTNSLVKNCTVIDCGYHGIMFVGSRCNGNVMRDCTIWGGAPNPISANSVGGDFYTSGPTATGGTWDHNLYNNLSDNVTMHTYTHLGVDGDPIAFPFDNAVETTAAPNPAYVTTLTAVGMLCHTNNEANNRLRAGSVIRNNCTVTNSGKISDGTNCAGNAFTTSDLNTGTGAVAAPSDPLNAALYPVQHYDCVASGLATNVLSGNLSASFTRCRFQLDRHGTAGNTSGAVGSGSGTHTILYDSCEFVTSMSAATARILFQSHAGNNLHFVNCSVYGTGTSANDKFFFNFSSSAGTGPGTGGYVFARGCIFGYKSDVGGNHNIVTTGFGWATAEFNQTVFDMNDCLYFGITAPAQVPGPNDFTAWTSGWASVGIDQGTVNNTTTNPFSDTTGATLELTTAARAIRKYLSNYGAAGINNQSYGGNYGAWQYPLGGNMFALLEQMLRRRRRRRRIEMEQAMTEMLNASEAEKVNA